MRPLALAVLLALASAPVLAAESTTPLAVGRPAPELALPDQHGRPLRLAELLEQRDFVVVAFYVKAFTGG
jgi:hypothetical protein